MFEKIFKSKIAITNFKTFYTPHRDHITKQHMISLRFKQNLQLKHRYNININYKVLKLYNSIE